MSCLKDKDRSLVDQEYPWIRKHHCTGNLVQYWRGSLCKNWAK